MKLAAMRLKQRDGVTCGPAVSVVAGALLDEEYRAQLTGGRTVDAKGRAWFLAEQGRIHDAVNVIWPRRLGTTPMGVARAIDVYGRRVGVRYGWRLFRGRRDRMADVVAAVEVGRPVAMLVGNAIPRHWVLLVAVGPSGELSCYEPSSGQLRSLDVVDVRASRLRGVGFPRPFAFVLPRSGSSAETLSATA